MEILTWIKERDTVPWYLYLNNKGKMVLDTSDIEGGSGVYCIFERFQPSDRQRHKVIHRTIYVGQGNIEQRLNDHAGETAINKFGLLLVTWAEVKGGEPKRKGIERYLADELDPVVGQHDNVKPIPVNLPY